MCLNGILTALMVRALLSAMAWLGQSHEGIQPSALSYWAAPQRRHPMLLPATAAASPQVEVERKRSHTVANRRIGSDASRGNDTADVVIRKR